MTTGDESTKAAAGKEGAAATKDAMEQRVIAFAEQLGRIYGTMQAKAEGWMDRDALNAQVTGVRDSATALLEQLGVGLKAGAAKGRQTLGTATGGGAKSGGAKASAAKTAGAKPTAPKTASKPAAKAGSDKASAKAKPSAKGKVASKMGASATSGATAKGAGTGRSGGAVDAPGKKHRKPMPSESAATGSARGEGSRIAKLKMANQARVVRRG